MLFFAGVVTGLELETTSGGVSVTGSLVIVGLTSIVELSKVLQANQFNSAGDLFNKPDFVVVVYVLGTVYLDLDVVVGSTGVVVVQGGARHGLILDKHGKLWFLAQQAMKININAIIEDCSPDSKAFCPSSKHDDNGSVGLIGGQGCGGGQGLGGQG